MIHVRRVAAAIAEEFEEPWEALKDRWRHPARSLAIVLADSTHRAGRRKGAPPLGSDKPAISPDDRNVWTLCVYFDTLEEYQRVRNEYSYIVHSH